MSYIKRFMEEVDQEIYRQGYSKTSFAKKLGIDRNIFYNRNPSTKMIERICDGLGYRPMLHMGYK